MRGIYKGAAARKRRDNSKAITYMHCNLVLVDAAKTVTPARNTFGTVGWVAQFSVKRHAVFEELQKNVRI